MDRSATAVHQGDQPQGTSWSFGTSWSITGLPGRVVALLVAVVVAGALMAPPQQHEAAAAVADRMVDNAGEIVEVIVQAVVGSDAAEESVARLGGTVVQRLGIIDGYVVRIPADKVDELRTSPGVASVSSNRRVELMSRRGIGDALRGTNTLAHVRRVTNADAANLFGIDGSGVGVGLVDTGVADVAGLPRVNRGPATNGGVSLDGYGHGTHLAGIIGGDDPGSSLLTFAGVANDSRVVSVNAAADDGSTNLAAVLSALDFILTNKDAKNIRVVNLSLGVTAGPDYRTDILAYAVERLWHAGIVVVVAAGNNGEQPGSPLTSPATDPYVIAVGSVDTKGTDGTWDDVVHAFSPVGTAARTVDVVAPGQSLVSLKAPGSVASTYTGALVGDRFIKGTGTSQAAAVVSGLVAALLEQRPNLTPDMVKSILMRSADTVSGSGDKDGQGMVDLGAALWKNAGSTYTQTWPRATGPVPSGTPLVPVPPPAPGDTSVPDCGVTNWDQPPAPPAPDGSSGTCGWVGGSWTDVTYDENGNFTGGSWTGGSWTGGSWTGGSWTGGSWTGGSWTGGSWTGGSWTGGSWTGGSWTVGTWTGGSWTGGSWTGGSWTGGSWTGGSWTGGSWTGGSWTGGSWTGGSWTGGSWTGGSWTGGSWTGGSWTGGSWTGGSWTAGHWEGETWVGGSWTGGSWTGGSWTGGSWTGGSWTGGSWTGGSWTGGSWTGGSWTGGSWTGGSWTGGSWTGGSWTGGSWTGGSWTGGSWTGGPWTGGSWTGGSWTGGSWTGGSWTGGSWTGGSWTGGSWTGGSWTGDAWTGTSWS